MNLQEALGFPFRDKNAVTKLVIGGVLYLVPIIGWCFLSGYFVEVARRVTADDENLMPEWDDWGERFNKGLLALLIAIIWITVALLPFMLIGILIILITDGGRGGGDIGSLLGMIGGILGSILAYFFLPASWGRYATTGKFLEAFNLRKIFGMILSNFGNYLGRWLLAGFFMLVAMIILWAIGAIACGIGAIFTQFFWNLFQAYLIGNLYKILNHS